MAFLQHPAPQHQFPVPKFEKREMKTLSGVREMRVPIKARMAPFLPVLLSTVVNYANESLIGRDLGSRESEQLADWSLQGQGQPPQTSPDMIRAGGRRYGDLSYMLGRRSPLQRPNGSIMDGSLEQWAPDVSLVLSVIRFALKTGRLGARFSSALLTHNSQRFGL